MKKKIFVLFSGLLMLAGIGCVSMSELITPAKIDGRAKTYALDRGADPNEYNWWPYGNLAMSNQLLRDVKSGHLKTLQEIEQAADRENLDYTLVFDLATKDNKMAVQREESLFGEKGLLTLGLGMLGFGSLTGFVGLMRKRPGDVSSADMEQAIAQAQGVAASELSAKQRQFVQLVQGVQSFINREKAGRGETDTLANLKSCLNNSQDTDCQIAVAAVKKELNL